jgi:hypothetical protein
MKKFQITEMVVILTGIGRKCIFPSGTVKKMVREAKKNPWAKVGEFTVLGHIFGSLSLQIYNQTAHPCQ